MRTKGYAEGFNEFLVVVGYNRQLKPGDPDRFLLQGRVSADMGMPPPVPELTTDEMQSVAFAAKMALAKVMVNRRRPLPKARKTETKEWIGRCASGKHGLDYKGQVCNLCRRAIYRAARVAP